MLGKLIKYEWKSTCKMGCLMLGVVALITFIGWLAFQSLVLGDWDLNAWVGILGIIGILTLVMYVIMLVAVNYGISVYLAVHFYKTMYTDEGYLTHTLPVTKHQILVSKIFVGGVWSFFILLSVYLSIMLLGMSMLTVLLPGGFSFSSMWRELEEMMYELRVNYRLDILGWLFAMLFSALVYPFSTVTIVFGAISIGQLFAKHRVLMAIVSYIGITVAMNIVDSVVRSVTAMALYGSFGQYINVSFNTKVFVNLAAAVGLYFVSWHVTNRKLNMA